MREKIKLGELRRLISEADAALKAEQDTGEIARLNRALREAAPVLLDIAEWAKAWHRHHCPPDLYPLLDALVEVDP